MTEPRQPSNQRYQPVGQLLQINPRREAQTAWLCEGCGSLVVDMTQHDYFHIRFEQGVGPFS